jgi:hypothetical protein
VAQPSPISARCWQRYRGINPEKSESGFSVLIVLIV